MINKQRRGALAKWRYPDLHYILSRMELPSVGTCVLGQKKRYWSYRDPDITTYGRPLSFNLDHLIYSCEQSHEDSYFSSLKWIILGNYIEASLYHTFKAHASSPLYTYLLISNHHCCEKILAMDVLKFIWDSGGKVNIGQWSRPGASAPLYSTLFILLSTMSSSCN